MPIIQSAKKQLRQNKKRNARNTHFKKLFTEARVAFEKAVKAGDAKTAKTLYINTTDKDGKTTKSGLQSLIDKLAKKNILHPNNASRKKAKYAGMIKSLEKA